MAIEPLRIANEILGYDAYRWRVASAAGTPTFSSDLITFPADTSIDDERRLLYGMGRPSLVLVCAGSNVEKLENRLAYLWLRECRRNRIPIGALCTGAYILGAAGLLVGTRCTIRWDYLASFAEKFPDAVVRSELYVQDRGIYTSGGGAATLDLVLKMIGEDFDRKVQSQICDQLLIDRVRDPSDRQRIPLRIHRAPIRPTVVAAITEMESNIEDPISLSEISRRIRLSTRHMERLFKNEFGLTPARYYNRLRLEKGRNLLHNSSMPVLEIAVACGFLSTSYFSKCFRDTYGVTPSTARKDFLTLLRT